MKLTSLSVCNITPGDPRRQEPPHIAITLALDPAEARALWADAQEQLLVRVADRVAAQPALDKTTFENELAAVAAEQRALRDRRVGLVRRAEAAGNNTSVPEQRLLARQLEDIDDALDVLAVRERDLRHRLTALDGALVEQVRHALAAERAAVAAAGEQGFAGLDAHLQTCGEMWSTKALFDALHAVDLAPMVEAVRLRLAERQAPAPVREPAVAAV